MSFCSDSQSGFSPTTSNFELLIYANVSHASNIFCCLALFVPLDSALSQSSMLGHPQALELFRTGMIWTAQTQCCCGLSVQVLPAGTWTQGWMCPLPVLHRLFLCVLLREAEVQQGTCFGKARRWASPVVIRNDQIECLCGRKNYLRLLN